MHEQILDSSMHFYKKTKEERKEKNYEAREKTCQLIAGAGNGDGTYCYSFRSTGNK